MINTKLTRLASKIAYKAHEGQTDKAGVPYIFHPIHIAEQMDSEESCVVALLHDVIEDSDITLEILLIFSFLCSWFWDRWGFLNFYYTR